MRYWPALGLVTALRFAERLVPAAFTAAKVGVASAASMLPSRSYRNRSKVYVVDPLPGTTIWPGPTIAICTAFATLVRLASSATAPAERLFRYPARVSVSRLVRVVLLVAAVVACDKAEAMSAFAGAV